MDRETVTSAPQLPSHSFPSIHPCQERPSWPLPDLVAAGVASPCLEGRSSGSGPAACVHGQRAGPPRQVNEVPGSVLGTQAQQAAASCLQYHNPSWSRSPSASPSMFIFPLERQLSPQPGAETSPASEVMEGPAERDRAQLQGRPQVSSSLAPPFTRHSEKPHTARKPSPR